MIDHPVSANQLAKLLRNRPATVLGWIKTGELEAIDVSATPGGKPRWRITPDAWDRFAASRAATPAPKRRKRRRRSTVKEYV